MEFFCNRHENGFEAMREHNMGTARLNIETGETEEMHHF
jgi:hypothetical protein